MQMKTCLVENGYLKHFLPGLEMIVQQIQLEEQMTEEEEKINEKQRLGHNEDRTFQVDGCDLNTIVNQSWLWCLVSNFDFLKNEKIELS